jgi:alpha-tubulin suppressor-like RCC1 family protein
MTARGAIQKLLGALAACAIAACGKGTSNAGATFTTNSQNVLGTASGSPNPSTYGQTVNFSATVSCGFAATGSITFSDSIVGTLCISPISGNAANCLYAALPAAATRTITASYPGDASCPGSSSIVFSQTVNKSNTSTTVSGPTPVTVSTSVSYTATVTAISPGVGTPTGTVTFSDTVAGLACSGGNTQTLVAGSATCTTSFSAAGSHTISASYVGDANFNATGGSSTSTSKAVNVVNVSTTALSTTLTPSKFGQSVTITATVSGPGPTPTGTVTFSDGSVSGPGALVCSGGSNAKTLNGSGAATCVTTNLSPGSHTIFGNYGADNNYAASNGSVVQVVNSTQVLSCWGDNSIAQLGQGSTDGSTHSSPLTVGSNIPWTPSNVSAGDFHGCNIDSYGQLWCWGSNQSQQTGQGPPLPTQNFAASNTGNAGTMSTTGGVNYIAQTFQTGTAVNTASALAAVDLFLSQSTSCTSNANLYVEVWATNPGNTTTGTPAGPTPIATSRPVRDCDVLGGTTGGNKVSFGMVSPPALLGGAKQYALVLRSDIPLTFPLFVSTGVGYPNGQAFTSSSSGATGTWFSAGQLQFSSWTGTGPALDVVQNTFSFAQAWSGGAIQHAQTFTPFAPGSLSLVDLGITRLSGGCSSSAVVQVDLRSTSPTGPLLASSTPVSVCALSTSGSRSSFVFPTPATVTASTLYVLVLKTNVPITGASAQVRGTPSPVYAGGNAFYSTDSGATFPSGAGPFGPSGSLLFRTYVGTPVAAFASSPIQVGALSNWTAVSAGGQHTCGVQSPGTLSCWGLNDRHQAGPSAFSPFAPPVQVGTDTDWSSLDLGGAFGCVLKTGQTAWCFGANDQGQAAVAGGFDLANATQITGAGAWTAISAGDSHACGFRAGTLVCWGDNRNGELGLGSFSSNPTPNAVPVPGSATSWSKASAGFQDTCALDNNNAAWCWGNNASDALGTGTPQAKLAPARVDARNFSQVVAGDLHSCALRSDGTAWCTGSNSNGQIGDGTNTTRLSWTQVLGTQTFTRLSAGGNVTCGLVSDGTLRCWGQNNRGQIGDGTSLDRNSPTLVSGGFSDWTSISAGGTHTCSRRATGGAVYCWGAFDNGQVGPSVTLSDALVPTAVGTLGSSLTAAAGGTQSCSISAASGLFCWGSNALGQAGLSPAAASQTPMQVGIATDWSAIAAGVQHSCGLEINKLSCFGDNAFGQIGMGAPPGPQLGPGVVGTGYRLVGAGDYHTCAITTGGALFCWGKNDFSQLGTGDTTQQNAPFAIGTDTNWATVAGGLKHSCGTRTDGSLWCWGDDSSGQLGDAPSRATPGAVVDPSTAPVPSGVAATANSSISVSRVRLPADGTSGTVITVVVKDSTNTPIAKQPVTLTVDGPAVNSPVCPATPTGPCATFTVSSGITDGAGVVSATLNTTIPSTKIVTAAVAGFNLNSPQITFTPGPADPTKTTLAVSPGQVAANGLPSATITVTAKDSLNNPLKSVPVSLSATGTARVITQPYGVFDATGTYTTTISSTGPETDNITAQVNSVTTAPQPITFVGPPAILKFTTQPAGPFPTGGSILGAGSAPLAVTTYDVNNVVVGNFWPAISVKIDIGANPGGATLAGLNPQSTVSGVASFGNLSLSQPGTGYTLVASATGTTSDTSSPPFTVTAPWSQIGPYGGSITSVTIKPTSGAVAYAATSIGVFKTTNSGTGWTPVRNGMGVRPVFSLVHRPDTSDTLYAGTDIGLYKSTDGGANWALSNGATIPASTPVKKVLQQPLFTGSGVSNANRVYAITDNTVYMSPDAGTSWAACTGLPSTGANGVLSNGVLAVDRNDSTRVFFVVADGSASFVKGTIDNTPTCSFAADGTSPATGSAATALEVSDDGATVYLTTATKGMYTRTGNVTWAQSSNSSLPLTSPIRSLARDASNNLFVGLDDGSAFKWTNGGTDWSSIGGSGLRNQQVMTLKVDPSNASTLWAGETNAGLFRTTNTGTTWSSNSGTTSATGIPLAKVTAMAVKPGTTGATTATVFAAPYGMGVQKSLNSGATWTATGTGLETVTKVSQFAFDSAGAIVYAATDVGLFKSADGGATWTSANGTSPNNITGPVNTVVADPTTTLKLYAGTSAGAFVSITGGTSWSAINGATGTAFDAGSAVTALSIDLKAPANLYAAGSTSSTANAMYSSTDSGGHWAKATGLATGCSVSSIANDSTTTAAAANVYAGCSSGPGVFQSTAASPGGFTAINTGLTGPGALNVTAAVANGAVVYASTGAGVFRFASGTWAIKSSGVPDLNVLSLALDLGTVGQPISGTILYAGTNSASAATTIVGGGP